MENGTRFFANQKCEYFPCHDFEAESAEFNCLFCYCPMNRLETCPGDPVFVKTKSGKTIKDCSGCTFPHHPENYDIIMEYLMKY